MTIQELYKSLSDQYNKQYALVVLSLMLSKPLFEIERLVLN